jgi:hypothetical protein
MNDQLKTTPRTAGQITSLKKFAAPEVARSTGENLHPAANKKNLPDPFCDYTFLNLVQSFYNVIYFEFLVVRLIVNYSYSLQVQPETFRDKVSGSRWQ